jgi:hypothetical protein
MDVFLLPVGNDGYELYCEHVDEPEVQDDTPLPDGFFARLKFRLRPARLKATFHQVLTEAERERRRESVTAPVGGWWYRMKRRAMRFIAESIAEQRLLWNLRRHDAATLYYPDDMTEEAALAVMRRQLGRDFDKHRFWLAIDSLLMVGSGVLILIPGPNVIGYYFAFRVVGHFFSVRGARNGLNRVTWTAVTSSPLTDLRRALLLEPADRLRQAEDVASRLRLDHLATFFQRAAVSS